MSSPPPQRPGQQPSWWQARLDPTGRFGRRATLIVAALVIVIVPFTTLLLEVVSKGPVTGFDGRVADSLNDWVHSRPAVVDATKVVTLFGQLPIEAIVVVGAAVWLLTRRPPRRRAAMWVVVTSLAGGLLNTLVKVAVDRPRPVVDHPVATALGKSFPSGHAMSATIVYGSLLVVCLPLVRRLARPLAVVTTVVLILAVGASRLLLGVHFVSDVIGGFLLGSAWLLASAVFLTSAGADPRPPPSARRLRRAPPGRSAFPDAAPAGPGAGPERLRGQRERGAWSRCGST